MNWGRLVKVLIISFATDVMLSAVLEATTTSWPRAFLWGCCLFLGSGVFLAVDAMYPRDDL